MCQLTRVLSAHSLQISVLYLLKCELCGLYGQNKSEPNQKLADLVDLFGQLLSRKCTFKTLGPEPPPLNRISFQCSYDRNSNTLYIFFERSNGKVPCPQTDEDQDSHLQSYQNIAKVKLEVCCLTYSLRIIIP